MSCIICYKPKAKCRCGKPKLAILCLMLLSSCSTVEPYSEYRQGCEDSSRAYVSEEMLSKYCDILVTIRQNTDEQRQKIAERNGNRK